MHLVGYCFAPRSQRRLCEEVHLNLAYRWFCRFDLSDPEDWVARETDPVGAPPVVREYLDTLDDEALGATTTAKPKLTAHADPASQWTAARKGPAFVACSDKYLIDTDHGITMVVDASRSNKTAEVGTMRKML
ncbi:Transposase and inactivated derivative [Roseobacter sp. SK209-2-6]|nr:Transposase and inactivated derivative [Roseobacter sp. SK209-2-6]